MTSRRPVRPGVVALLCVVAAAAIAAPVAGAPSASDRKAQVDARLERADARARAARARETVLTTEVEAYSTRVRRAEARLAPLDRRARALEGERDRLRDRLEALATRLGDERTRLVVARRRLADRRAYLSTRVVEIYRRGNDVDMVGLLLQGRSLTEIMAVTDLLDRAVVRDRDLAAAIRRHAREIRETRDRIAEIHRRVGEDEARASEVAGRARAAAVVVERQRDHLARVRGDRRALLSRVRGDRREFEGEVDALQRESGRLAAKIRAAQGLPSGGSVRVGAPSSAGLSWPVSGALTSRFGMRWGRMHEGIDIGVGAGTPIGAAAGGTVIVAGWQGGYGNLVVVDHGNGLSTAYAHQSRIAVSVGRTVGRGSVLGYVGCTGHCFGDHLHFEVRVNGSAVDPLGYL